MNDIIKAIEEEQLKQEVPEFSVGDTVRVYGKIKEGNRERVQVFEGVVLKKQGGSNRATFTVRKSSNGIGVEKTWPLHSPNVEKVELVRKGKVRRAKLNYLRDRVGKKPKLKNWLNNRIRYEGQPLWWLSLFILLMQRFCFLDINTVSFVAGKTEMLARFAPFVIECKRRLANDRKKQA